MESIWNAASRVVAPIFQPYKNRGVFLKTDSGHLFPSPLSGEGCPKGGVGCREAGRSGPFRLGGAGLIGVLNCDVDERDGLP